MISRIVRRAMSDRHRAKVGDLLSGIRSGNRAALSQSITLVESKNTQKREMAKLILHTLLSEPPPKEAYRIGLSGPPGAGKSTFIENMGKWFLHFDLKIF